MFFWCNALRKSLICWAISRISLELKLRSLKVLMGKSSNLCGFNKKIKEKNVNHQEKGIILLPASGVL